MHNKSVVVISKIRQFHNKSDIENEIFNLLNIMKNKDKIEIPSKANIMIKPNICSIKSHETGTTVDPFIVKCIIDWLLQNYDIKSIIIGETDASELDIDMAFKLLGWENIFNSYPKVRLLNLTKDEYIDTNLDGLYFKTLKMSKSYMKSDFLISIGKLKTHIWTGMTCILKNQFGANPIKNKEQYHHNIDKVIHDLNKVKLPNLCFVDGIISMEGNGPIDGKPKPSGLLILGNDVVATDHVCARIIGFDPDKILHLKLAKIQKLGYIDYDIYGERIDDVYINFKMP